jgi:hypothetical protein
MLTPEREKQFRHEICISGYMFSREEMEELFAEIDRLRAENDKHWRDECEKIRQERDNLRDMLKVWIATQKEVRADMRDAFLSVAKERDQLLEKFKMPEASAAIDQAWERFTP